MDESKDVGLNIQNAISRLSFVFDFKSDRFVFTESIIIWAAIDLFLADLCLEKKTWLKRKTDARNQTLSLAGAKIHGTESQERFLRKQKVKVLFDELLVNLFLFQHILESKFLHLTNSSLLLQFLIFTQFRHLQKLILPKNMGATYT